MLDLTGIKHGRLTPIERIGKTNHGVTLWRCICECGKETTTQQGSLRNGRAKSCGCYAQEKRLTHGRSRTSDPTYQSWNHMKDRCRNKNHVAYPRYGGSEVTVCDRWLDFDNFVADMGNRPLGTTLDRLNRQGNYEPGNCAWKTPKEQANNRKSSRLITFNGITKSLTDWAASCGVKDTTLAYRLDNGWPIEEAITRCAHKSLDSRYALNT